MSTESATTPFVQPGTVLADKYRILDSVCDGASASVFRAQHLVLGEAVVLRVLRPELHRASGESHRFVQGAKALMRLHHDRVARVVDVGQLDDGLPFMALEDLDGQTLQQEVERRGWLAPELSIGLLAQLGQALEAARAAGIERQGLDPADIFVSTAGAEPRLWLIGLGLSETGTRDARADVYDLGTLLFLMLTGQSPSTADTVPAEGAGAHDAITDERLAAIVRRARDPEPARRQGSIAELLSALDEPAPQGAAKTLVQGTQVAAGEPAGSRLVGRTLESEGVPPTPVSMEPLVQVEGSTSGRPTLVSAEDGPSPPSSTVPEGPSPASRSITVPQGPFVSSAEAAMSQTMHQAPSLTEPGSTATTLREGTAPPSDPKWWEGREWVLGLALAAAILAALGLWWRLAEPAVEEEPERPAELTPPPPPASASTGPRPLIREEPPPSATPAPVPQTAPRPAPRPAPPPTPPPRWRQPPPQPRPDVLF